MNYANEWLQQMQSLSYGRCRKLKQHELVPSWSLARHATNSLHRRHLSIMQRLSPHRAHRHSPLSYRFLKRVSPSKFHTPSCTQSRTRLSIELVCCRDLSESDQPSHHRHWSRVRSDCTCRPTDRATDRLDASDQLTD